MKTKILCTLFLALLINNNYLFAQNEFPSPWGDATFDGNQILHDSNSFGIFNFTNGASLWFGGINPGGFPGYIRLYPNSGFLYNNTLTQIGNGQIDFNEDIHTLSESWFNGLLFDGKYFTQTARVGATGTGNSLDRIFITFGSTPSQSTLGINILPDGSTGIGTLSPSTRLHIKSGTANNSGLRLENLTSSSPSTANAKAIGVTSTGQVVTIDVDSAGSSDRAWLTEGNIKTIASNATYGNNVNNNFLGTIDNQPLVIATNNKERVRISTSGRLTFHNNDISPNAVNNLYIGGGNEVTIGADNYANTAIGLGSLPSITSGGNRNTAIGSNALVRNTSGDKNIGIGYNAGANLTSGSNNIIIGNVNAPLSSSTSNQLNIGGWIFGKSGQIAIGSFTNLSQAFTNNEEYQLIVKKGIRTEKVRVDLSNVNNWADYVFKDGYEIMPLEELEKFIESNRHLPNIPKAEQLAEEGMDLAEMDAKLLEKIEELTLYNIDLYKENKELKEENVQQQKLLDELIKRVEQLESAK